MDISAHCQPAKAQLVPLSISNRRLKQENTMLYSLYLRIKPSNRLSKRAKNHWQPMLNSLLNERRGYLAAQDRRCNQG